MYIHKNDTYNVYIYINDTYTNTRTHKLMTHTRQHTNTDWLFECPSSFWGISRPHCRPVNSDYLLLSTCKGQLRADTVALLYLRPPSCQEKMSGRLCAPSLAFASTEFATCKHSSSKQHCRENMNILKRNNTPSPQKRKINKTNNKPRKKERDIGSEIRDVSPCSSLLRGTDEEASPPVGFRGAWSMCESSRGPVAAEGPKYRTGKKRWPIRHVEARSSITQIRKGEEKEKTMTKGIVI